MGDFIQYKSVRRHANTCWDRDDLVLRSLPYYNTLTLHFSTKPKSR